MRKPLVVLALVLIYTAFIFLTAGDENNIPIALYTARGTSMLPAIHDGDILVVFKGAKFEVGNIISANILGKMVAHRVIGIYADGRVVETKGDNVEEADVLISREDVVGKVILVMPAWVLFTPYLAAMVLGFVWRNEL